MVQFPLGLQLLGNALAGVTTFSTETLDLAEGGAKLRVPEELPLGQRLVIHLELPDGSRHWCRAQVRRSGRTPEREGESGPWAAVQFVDSSEEMRAAISELIASANLDAVGQSAS